MFEVKWILLRFKIISKRFNKYLLFNNLNTISNNDLFSEINLNQYDLILTMSCSKELTLATDPYLTKHQNIWQPGSTSFG